MQAALLLILFSLLSTILAGVFLTGNKSTAELTQQREESTRTFFKNIDEVINTSLTPQWLQATTPAITQQGPAYMVDHTQELAALGSGRWPTPGVDAWGRPIDGVVKRSNVTLYSDPNSSVTVPVTTVALISPGVDGVLDPNLQTQLDAVKLLPLNASTQALGLNAFNTGNDIVYTFNDEAAQRTLWEHMQSQVKLITDMAFSYYQQQYLLNQATAAFPNLTNASVRKSLGMQAIFDDIQRPLPNGGHLVVTPDTSVAGEFKLTVSDPTHVTPWSNFVYVKTITANGS